MKFPATVKSIVSSEDPSYIELSAKCGDYVAVRPCGDEYEDKTFLGIYICDVSLINNVYFKEETGELTIRRSMHNPMMFVPELNKNILGIESFWKKINRKEDLESITDKDIENVWCVKALRLMEGTLSGG
jgi:hypothetical protein